jgi:hypothetical protein
MRVEYNRKVVSYAWSTKVVNYELYVGLICMYCDAIRGVMVISVGQDHSYIITRNPFITLEAHRDPTRGATLPRADLERFPFRPSPAARRRSP